MSQAVVTHQEDTYTFEALSGQRALDQLEPIKSFLSEILTERHHADFPAQALATTCHPESSRLIADMTRGVAELGSFTTYLARASTNDIVGVGVVQSHKSRYRRYPEPRLLLHETVSHADKDIEFVGAALLYFGLEGYRDNVSATLWADESDESKVSWLKSLGFITSSNRAFYNVGDAGRITRTHLSTAISIKNIRYRIYDPYAASLRYQSVS